MSTQTWKHKETNEVIDHLTYLDLPETHRADFEDATCSEKEQVEAPAENEPEAPIVSNPNESVAEQVEDIIRAEDREEN